MKTFITTVYAQEKPEITNPALVPALRDQAPNEQFATLITNLWRTMIILGGIAFLLYTIWAGVKWITAGGDASKIEEAKQQLTQGIIGLAVLAGTVAVAYFVSDVVGLDLLTPVFPTPGGN